jgi:hypothetical protein
VEGHGCELGGGCASFFIEELGRALTLGRRGETGWCTRAEEAKQSRMDDSLFCNLFVEIQIVYGMLTWTNKWLIDVYNLRECHSCMR